MPVLKVYKNGVWEDVAGASGHTHEISDITNFPSSLPANGGNADTLDGKHADEFASVADVEALQTKVGDTTVSEQINTAISEIEIPEHTWESLPDKPFDENEIVIFPEAVVDGFVDEDENGIFMADFSYSVYPFINHGATFLKGEIFNVIWDGEAYLVVCNGGGAIGNLHLLDPANEDTGVPFLIQRVGRQLPQVIHTNTPGAYHSVQIIWSEIKTIDPKFIPNTIARINDIPDHTWESLPDKPFDREVYTITNETDYFIPVEGTDGAIGKISDIVVPRKYLIGAEVDYDGTKDILTQERFDSLVQNGLITDDFVLVGDTLVMVYTAGVVVGELTFSEIGTYSVPAEVLKLSITWEELKTLDEQFIPDTIARVSDLEDINAKVGDTTVSEQIATATENKLVPTCTTADNGKFLRVVDGVAAWVDVPSAEGVSF